MLTSLLRIHFAMLFVAVWGCHAVRGSEEQESEEQESEEQESEEQEKGGGKDTAKELGSWTFDEEFTEGVWVDLGKKIDHLDRQMFLDEEDTNERSTRFFLSEDTMNKHYYKYPTTSKKPDEFSRREIKLILNSYLRVHQLRYHCTRIRRQGWNPFGHGPLYNKVVTFSEEEIDESKCLKVVIRRYYYHIREREILGVIIFVALLILVGIRELVHGIRTRKLLKVQQELEELEEIEGDPYAEEEYEVEGAAALRVSDE